MCQLFIDDVYVPSTLTTVASPDRVGIQIPALSFLSPSFTIAGYKSVELRVADTTITAIRVTDAATGTGIGISTGTGATTPIVTATNLTYYIDAPPCDKWIQNRNTRNIFSP